MQCCTEEQLIVFHISFLLLSPQLQFLSQPVFHEQHPSQQYLQFISQNLQCAIVYHHTSVRFSVSPVSELKQVCELLFFFSFTNKPNIYIQFPLADSLFSLQISLSAVTKPLTWSHVQYITFLRCTWIDLTFTCVSNVSCRCFPKVLYPVKNFLLEYKFMYIKSCLQFISLCYIPKKLQKKHTV